MARNALIQVRRDTAANWSSVNPTLASGEIGLETDTGRYKIGNGSTPWNSLQISLKADELRLGSDYVTPYTGFRNAIINGDFRINQRAFTSTATNGTYGFDRWVIGYNSGTMTYSSQTFTVGSPAAIGYESPTFARVVTANQTGTGHFALFNQKIEDVRTFSNATVTISFWAKASSGTPKVAIEIEQFFGSGGSPSANVTTAFGAVTLSTSWARYSVTGTIPNINGKTIGTTANTSYTVLNLWVSAGSSFDSRASSIGTQNNTFDFWGVQVERGLVATPFEQRPVGAELALCQRYYFQSTTTLVLSMPLVAVGADNVNYCTFSFPVPMRSAPNVAISNIVAEGHHTNSPTITSSSAHLVGFEYNGANERSPGIRLNIGNLTAEKEF